MDSQSFDTTRMFTTDTGPSCSYSCPKCDCDGRDEGDEWYVEYQSIYDIPVNEAKCRKCECKSDGEGNLYADCEFSFTSDYIIDSQACPAPEDEEEESYECHYEESTSGTSFSLFMDIQKKNHFPSLWYIYNNP